MIKKLLILIGFLFLLWPTNSKAAVGEYIDSFSSKITVNKDSSLDIQEEIKYFFPAPKHGIFRVIPTQVYKTSSQAIKTPVKLLSITDEKNNPINHKEPSDGSNRTVSWQIGDANTTVTGLQTYKIHYQVQNVIRFDNFNFDEFYWNLNGNFWEIPINKFSAEIIFPESVTEKNSQISVYSGTFGTKDAGLAANEWTSANTLTFTSARSLGVGEGITASVTFPKNIFTPYVPTFLEKYGQYFFLILPLFFLFVCLNLWKKYGQDPKIIGPVVPEFGIPENLSPMEMGELISNGQLLDKYISAGIVNLAVKKIIKIEQTSKSNYKLVLLDEKGTLSESEKLLINKLFDGKKETSTEDLKNNFYDKISSIQTSIGNHLKSLGLYQPTAWWIPTLFVMGAIALFVLIFFVYSLGGMAVLSLLISIIILVIFTILMPRRTAKGATLMKKVEGFKLYMKTAERYRQEFNEKENIFEKFLPYAMVFGIVSEWTKSFAKIYQEVHHQDYFATYHPIWFAGIASGQFNPDIFSANISSLSSHMSSTLSSSPSSSGSGGGGFSGGGGGGGGGGSW